MAEKLLHNKKGKLPLAPLVLLIIVVIITAGLFVYNKKMQADLEVINADITAREAAKKSLEKDKTLQVYKILESKKSVLETYEKYNNITDYMSHLDQTAAKYGLKLQGFSINEGTITTNVTVQSRQKSKPSYEKVRDFIQKYRADEKSKLDLLFINSFQGNDTITFTLTFKIK